MTGLTKKQNDLMLRFLNRKRQEFSQKIEHYNAIVREEKTVEANDRSCTHGISHLADCINECSLLGNPEQMLGEKRRCLQKIDNAMDAIKKGTYGVCSLCGEEINFKRLRDIPFAEHCIECAKDREIKLEKMK